MLMKHIYLCIENKKEYMRKILLGLLLLCSIGVMAQNEYEKEQVIQAPNKSVEDIYKSLKTWFVENAKYDSRNILQIDSKADGQLMGKANISIAFNNMTWNAMSGTISFIVDIKIKDGRFKTKFYQFSHQRKDMSLSSLWDQGIVYSELPEERQSGMKWKAYRVFLAKAIPMLDTWCEETFKNMEQKVNISVSTDNDDW